MGNGKMGNSEMGNGKMGNGEVDCHHLINWQTNLEPSQTVIGEVTQGLRGMRDL